MNALAGELIETKLQTNVKMFEELIEQEYGALILNNNTLITETGKDIKGEYHLVDKMKNLTSDVYTIFAANGNDFKRISTNIVKENGKRAIGNMLGTDSLAYSSILNK